MSSIMLQCKLLLLLLLFSKISFGNGFVCEKLFLKFTNSYNNELLKQVATVLDEKSIDYALAGGYAMILHGAVRETSDVDIIVSHGAQNFSRVEKALNSIGFRSMLEMDASEIFHSINNLLNIKKHYVWSFYRKGESYEYMDVLLNYDLEDANIEIKHALGMDLKVASIKDLINMKYFLSLREKDIKDIELLKDILKNKGLDLDQNFKSPKTNMGNKTGKSSIHGFMQKKRIERDSSSDFMDPFFKNDFDDF